MLPPPGVLFFFRRMRTRWATARGPSRRPNVLHMNTHRFSDKPSAKAVCTRAHSIRPLDMTYSQAGRVPASVSASCKNAQLPESGRAGQLACKSRPICKSTHALCLTWQSASVAALARLRARLGRARAGGHMHYPGSGRVAAPAEPCSWLAEVRENAMMHTDPYGRTRSALDRPGMHRHVCSAAQQLHGVETHTLDSIRPGHLASAAGSPPILQRCARLQGVKARDTAAKSERRSMTPRGARPRWASSSG